MANYNGGVSALPRIKGSELSMKLLKIYNILKYSLKVNINY